MTVTAHNSFPDRHRELRMWNSVSILFLFPSCGCRTGFSLLFYGLGSKQNLLKAFAETFILVTGGKCIEVFGYLPHINLKEVQCNLEPSCGGTRLTTFLANTQPTWSYRF